MKQLKRVMLLLTLVLMLCFTACEEKKETSSTETDLQSNPTAAQGEDTTPSETEETSAAAEEEPMVLVEVDDWIYIYDENMQLVREEYYYDSQLKRYSEYEYAPQADGTMIVTVTKKWADDPEGKYSDTYERVYDEKGHCISELDFSNNWKTEYFYDENGWLIKEVYLDQSRAEHLWTDLIYTYTYDENGNLITKREVARDHDDPEAPEVLKSLYEYTYNENGETLTRKYTYQTSQNPDAFEDQTHIFEWETDDRGDSIYKKQKLVEGYGYTESILYEYDENGCLIRVSHSDSDGAFHADTYSSIPYLVPHDIEQRELEYMSWSQYLQTTGAQ